MDRNIKVVIGANFGDEGKGLMTDYFCHQLHEDGHRVLNIRYNGSAQAAHNVVTPEGKHHTFSHVGSGSFVDGVDTYLGPEFVVHPMLFCREMDHLKAIGIKPRIFVHKDCRIATPYDMMINQFLERSRGNGRHGTCGIGFDETLKRYVSPFAYLCSCNTVVGMLQEKLNSSDLSGYVSELNRIRRSYVPLRMAELGVPLTKEEKALVDNDNVFHNFLGQLAEFLECCEIVDESIIKNYDGIVFEGAQGLLLDTDYFIFAPHLTSSKTGSFIPKKMLYRADMNLENIEFCYVTRTYFTRHGFGPFPTECTPEELFGKAPIEKHNMKNEFQGDFRFGYFEELRFNDVVAADYYLMTHEFPNDRCTVAVTHADETDGYIIHPGEKEKIGEFNCTPDYVGKGETRLSVESLQVTFIDN